jgi:bla regulator protein blaR1
VNLALYLAALLLWSALHLLWQGALISALFTWWRRATKPRPSARYRAAVGGLLMLAAAFIANAAVTHAALLGNARLGPEGALIVERRETLGAIAAAFDRSFDGITVLALLWAVGVSVGILRLAIGSWHLGQLRQRGVSAPSSLVERVHTLAQRMMIDTPPLVLISDASVGPFVVGRSPGVLMLPSEVEQGEELDALILHELAHIKRRDYESNTMLRVVQTLLWFHPAIWQLVRAAVNAREESCDTDAVAHSRSSLVLARALVRLEERRHASGAMIAASSGALTTRVRQLIADAPVDSASRGWSRATPATPAIASIVVFIAGSVLAARLAPQSDRLALVGATANALPVQRMVIKATDPAGHFTLTLLNGRVAGATIAGVPVARPAIHRNQRMLSLTDMRGEPVVSMELDPRGAIHWMPRSRGSTHLPGR